MKYKLPILFAVLFCAISVLVMINPSSRSYRPFEPREPSIFTLVDHVSGLKIITNSSEPLLLFLVHLLIWVPGIQLLSVLIFPCFMALVGFGIGTIISKLSRKQLIIVAFLYLCFIVYRYYNFQKIYSPTSSTDCAALSSRSERKNCVLNLALALQDPNICLIKNSKTPQMPYFDPGLLFECLSMLKYKMNGADFCNSVNDPNAKKICTSMVSRKRR